MSDPIYRYTIPMDQGDDDVLRPIVKPDIQGQLHLWHVHAPRQELIVLQTEPDYGLHEHSEVEVTIHLQEYLEFVREETDRNLVEVFVEDSSPLEKFI